MSTYASALLGGRPTPLNCDWPGSLVQPSWCQASSSIMYLQDPCAAVDQPLFCVTIIKSRHTAVPASVAAIVTCDYSLKKPALGRRLYSAAVGLVLHLLDTERHTVPQVQLGRNVDYAAGSYPRHSCTIMQAIYDRGADVKG